MEGSKRAERTFVVDDFDPETGAVDRNAVMAALGDIEAVGHRLGGAFIIAPIRQVLQVQDAMGRVRSEHRTTGWIIEFVKYVPAVEPPQPTATEAGQEAAAEQAQQQASDAAQAAREVLEEREPEPVAAE